jgi:hypothetical protein
MFHHTVFFSDFPLLLYATIQLSAGVGETSTMRAQTHLLAVRRKKGKKNDRKRGRERKINKQLSKIER